MSDNTVTYTIVPASGYEVVCLDGPDVKKLSSVTRLVIAFCIPLEANGCAGRPRPITVLGEPRNYLLRHRAYAGSGGIDQDGVKWKSTNEFIEKFIEKGATP